MIKYAEENSERTKNLHHAINNWKIEFQNYEVMLYHISFSHLCVKTCIACIHLMTGAVSIH